MLTVQESHATFKQVVSKQNIAGDTRYRLLIYCIDIPYHEGHLIFNSLSCELIFIDNDEYASLYTNQYLINHWFLVPENFDDKKFAKQSLEIIKLFTTSNQVKYNFTIFTTTDCNARCFYCFQKGIPHNFLSEEIADKIIDYILKQYNNNLKSNSKKLLLQWFGGEPLYNHKIISYICERLKLAGAEYRSRMISNGFLFDKELAQIAHDLWRLRKVQITLDGTENVYNRVKNYIYPDTNAYKRVLDNIQYLLDSKINVSVRLNADAYNVDNLMELASELSKRFGGRKGFSCYARALFEQDERKFTQRTDAQRTIVFNKLRELDEKLVEYKLSRGSSLPSQPRMVFCKADADNGFTITPDGRMGLCDYYTQSNFVAHIDNPEVIDNSVIAGFKEHCDDLPICDDCPLYPQCIRLKKCGEENICFSQMKQYKIDKLKSSMLSTYDMWINKQDQTDEEDKLDYSELGNC